MTDPGENQSVPLDGSAYALSDVLDLTHLQGEELIAVRAADGHDVVIPGSKIVESFLCADRLDNVFGVSTPRAGSAPRVARSFQPRRTAA